MLGGIANEWNVGNNIKVSIFGESHGNAIGINIDGLPSGFEIDMEKLLLEMERRAPGKIQCLQQGVREGSSRNIKWIF